MVAKEASAVIHLVFPAREGAVSLKELCLYDFFLSSVQVWCVLMEISSGFILFQVDSYS